MPKINYDSNYETIIRRIVSGELPFSEESIRLYGFYRDYINQKKPDEMLPVHRKYLEMYDSLPKFKKRKRKME